MNRGKGKSRKLQPEPGLGRRRRRRWIFDPLAWLVLMVVLVYLDISLAWMFLIVPSWVVLRLILFRKRCIDQGLW